MELRERDIFRKVGRVSRAITKRRRGVKTAEDIVFFSGSKGFRIDSTYLRKLSRGEWTVCLGSASNPHASFEDAALNARVVWTYNTYSKRVIAGRRSDGKVIAPDYRDFSHKPLDA